METRTAATLALAGVGGAVCMAAALLQRQRRNRSAAEPELEHVLKANAAMERERWLSSIGVQWVDGRAPAQDVPQMDIVDLAVELANFSSEVGHEANGRGGCVDRKPHKQRMSADFGGPMHDGVRRSLASSPFADHRASSSDQWRCSMAGPKHATRRNEHPGHAYRQRPGCAWLAPTLGAARRCGARHLRRHAADPDVCRCRNRPGKEAHRCTV